MQKRRLGRTGAEVTILGMGGGRIGVTKPPTREEAVALINRGLDLGINFIDTAPSYGNGESETRIGIVMEKRRHEVFLATKVDSRTKDEASAEIKPSLGRLHVKSVDLLQIHGLNDFETLRQVSAPTGSLAALQEARETGLTRFIGITGHRQAEVLGEAIRRFDFDTVMMPVGLVDEALGSFVERVLPLAEERAVGVIGMKAIGHGLLSQRGDESLRFALGQPVSSVVVGLSSIRELDRDVAIADSLTPLSRTGMSSLLASARASVKPEEAWWRQPPS